LLLPLALFLSLLLLLLLPLPLPIWSSFRSVAEESAFAFCFCCCLCRRVQVKPRIQASREAATALPKAGALIPKGEATDFITVTFTAIFFRHFLPKNRMSSPKTT
jgi:hypothetical protein